LIQLLPKIRTFPLDIDCLDIFVHFLLLSLSLPVIDQNGVDN